MADLSSDVQLRFRFPALQKRELWPVDTSTAQTFYKGQPVFLDANVDTVNLRAYVAADTVATGDATVGIAMEGLTVASGATESANEIEVLVSGEVGFKSAVFTNADVGKTVYASDSGTLTATATDNLKLGPLVRVADGFAYVDVNPTGAPTLN